MPNITGTDDAETLVGTMDADTIEGLGGNDLLVGAGGADIMKGGAGDDVYLVDEPGDQAIELAGEGNDEVRSSIGFVLGSHIESLTLTGAGAIDGTGNDLNNRIVGNDSANIFRDGGGSDMFVGGGGDDYFYVRTDVVVDGEGGYAFSGVDQVVELAGGGVDTIDSDVGGTLPAEVENMILVGSLNISAFGNGLDNAIFGNSGRNLLRGAGGNDYIDGGAGADNMDGGAGDDTYVVDDPLDILSEAPNGGIDTVRASISHALGFSFENLVLTGDAAIDGTGNSRANLITGNDAANHLSGDGGDDSIDGLAGADEIDGSFGSDTLRGGDGSDVLRGGPGDDVIYGEQGADTLYGDDGGSDAAYGGDGDDGFYFGSRLDASDWVDGGSGIDTLAIRGALGADFRFGAANLLGIEVLLVASGANVGFPNGSAPATFSYDLITRDENVAARSILTVIAGSPGGGVPGLQAAETLAFDGSAESDGAFRIFAGLGADRLIGGAGDDGFFFATGALTSADRIDGGGGTDTIALRGDYGGQPLTLADASLKGVEVLSLLSAHSNPFGGAIRDEGFDYSVVSADGNLAAGARLDVNGANLAADETLIFDGAAEQDGSFRIIAGAGDDSLRGGAGGDLIYGGLGADRLEGGAGSDLYVYRSVAESVSRAIDRILFGTGDRIDLSFIDADPSTQENDEFAFIGTASFSGRSGELRAFGANGLWSVEADIDGDTVADLVIAVTTSQPTLAAGDFVL